MAKGTPLPPVTGPSTVGLGTAPAATAEPRTTTDASERSIDGPPCAPRVACDPLFARIRPGLQSAGARPKRRRDEPPGHPRRASDRTARAASLPDGRGPRRRARTRRGPLPDRPALDRPGEPRLDAGSDLSRRGGARTGHGGLHARGGRPGERDGDRPRDRRRVRGGLAGVRGPARERRPPGHRPRPADAPPNRSLLANRLDRARFHAVKHGGSPPRAATMRVL